MTQNENSCGNEHLLERITRHVFLVVLNISWPKLSYQIADVVVEVRGDDDAKTEVDKEFRTSPQWQLMPADWRRKLVNLEGRARTLLSAASIQFATRGMTVLPVTRAAEIFRGLRELRTELEEYRDGFVANYEQVLSELKGRLGDALYAKAVQKLPSKDVIRQKFKMVWAIVPAGGHGSINSTQLSALRAGLEEAKNSIEVDIMGELPALNNALDIVRNLQQESPRTIDDDDAQDLIGEAREQMSQFTQQMLADMAKEPRAVLADAADNLLQALSDPNRVVRMGTIDQVRRAFEMVEGFSFLADDELLERMRQCQLRLDNVTPQQLNSDLEIGGRLAAGLQSVREQASDTHAQADAVRNFRRVKWRKGRKEQPTEPVTG